MHPDVSVIVPTYCEVDNLVELIPRIHWALRTAHLENEIIVVDDNSEDGTVEVCASLEESHHVRLEVRRNARGLSTAVLHGMDQAKGEILVVMDADLSHPPESVPALVRAIREGAEMAIGSRYVDGGETEEEWGFFRWLNSKVATLLARPLTTVKDPMAGFFALHRVTLSKASALDPVGYKIGLELLVKCGCQRVKEIPIRFSDRTRGTSKLCLREQCNYVRHLKRLYDYKFGGTSTLLQFLAIGATGMIVDLVAFVLGAIFMPMGLARGVAIWIAMTWNWLLNRNVTFRGTGGRTCPEEYLLFCGSCALGGAVNWFVTMALCTNVAFLARFPLIAACVGIGLGTIVNAAMCIRVVFQDNTKSHVPKHAPASKPRKPSRPFAMPQRSANPALASPRSTTTQD
jgi:dolichol-phosphate mannosyltransferase